MFGYSRVHCIHHGRSQIFALFMTVNHSIFRPQQGKENPKYLGLSPRSSSEMTKLPTSEQENPKFLRLDCKSMHCREINQNFL